MKTQSNGVRAKSHRKLFFLTVDYDACRSHWLNLKRVRFSPIRLRRATRRKVTLCVTPPELRLENLNYIILCACCNLCPSRSPWFDLTNNIFRGRRCCGDDQIKDGEMGWACSRPLERPTRGCALMGRTMNLRVPESAATHDQGERLSASHVLIRPRSFVNIWTLPPPPRNTHTVDLVTGEPSNAASGYTCPVFPALSVGEKSRKGIH